MLGECPQRDTGSLHSMGEGHWQTVEKNIISRCAWVIECTKEMLCGSTIKGGPKLASVRIDQTVLVSLGGKPCTYRQMGSSTSRCSQTHLQNLLTWEHLPGMLLHSKHPELIRPSKPKMVIVLYTWFPVFVLKALRLLRAITKSSYYKTTIR